MDSQRLVARIAGELGSTAWGGAPLPPTPPPLVPDHELVGRIGAGSYGEVWLARGITGTWRAVKVVSRARFESERPYEREFRGVVQFEPISRSHVGLIQVLHVGRDDAVGAFYYVMELADSVEGPVGSPPPSNADANANAGGTPALSPTAPYRPRTLRSELDARGRLPVAEVVALGVQLCGALGHIHRSGLVHRDVKPSNVIFVQGLPKLADLGLVATADEARSFVGTEGFIPPEGPGTVQADLFALGRLLYEAATGKDRCEFPELPPDLDTWPDRTEFLELNEVLARLCAPDPARRSTNAADAAGDLNLVLAGRSVRRAYGIERRLRWASRIAALGGAVLALAATVVWVQEVRQRREAARAAQERSLRERAQAAERSSRQQLYTALLEQARATVRSGELGQRVRALDAIRRAAAISNSVELRREAIAALGLPDLQFERELPLGGDYTARQLDPAFQRVAVANGRRPVELRRTADNQVLGVLTPATNLACYDLQWSPDGRYLAAKRVSDRNPAVSLIEIWDVAEDERLVMTIPDSRGTLREFHPSRPQFLTSDSEGRVVTWDLERAVEVGRRRLGAGVLTDLLHTPDGRRFATIDRQRNAWQVSVWDADDDRQLLSHSFPVMLVALAWHPDGASLAFTDQHGSVHLLDPKADTIRTLGRHRAEAVTAAFALHGDYLVTGGWERSLLCWDLRTGQRGLVIELDAYEIQFSVDGNQCALLTPNAVQILNFEQPVQRRFAEDLGSRLRFAAFSPDGRWIAASADERLGVWELDSGTPGTLAEAGAESSPSWTPDSSELFASRRDKEGVRWRVRPSAQPGAVPALEPLPLPRPEGFAWLTVASNLVAWTSAKGTQIVGLDQVAPRDDHWQQTAYGMSAFSPSRRWLAIYRGYSRYLHVYQLPELTQVATLTNRAAISGFQFSPSEDVVAVASRGQVEFWSTRTWEPTRVLTNFAGIPHVGVLAQPDGTGWWLAANQRFACLHDPRTLEPRLPLPSAMAPLAVSPDGRFLAAAADSRRLEVWDLARLREQLGSLGLEY